jgi:hypothetical protein
VAPLGLWLVGDAGYGWAPRHPITLAPTLPAGDAQKAGEVALGTLAARGLFARLGLALAY